MRAPPNWLPSKTTTSSWARDEYTAAVYPAGPEPTMITSWMVCSLTWASTRGSARGFPGWPRSPADERVGEGERRPGRAIGPDGQQPEQRGRPGGQHEQNA